MPSKDLHIALIILTIICLLISIFTSSNYKEWSAAMAMNFLVSAVFYYLVVYIPEKQRIRRVRSRMERRYKEFKLSCIEIFLSMCNSQECPPESLLELAEFKRYFKNQDRWDSVANSMQSNEYYLNSLLGELRTLNEEFNIIRNSVDIHNDEVFDFFRNAIHIIRRLDATKRDYDDIKSLCRTFWEIFAGWSFANGDMEKDIIQEMLVEIK